MATPATTETFADVSKAVCEKVDEACRDILRHMKDIGADATERTSEFTKLQAELLATCEKSVTSWSKTADDLRGKISSGQEEISQLVKAMQEPTPSTVTEVRTPNRFSMCLPKLTDASLCH